MEVATREGCGAIAHGSTGKGNDQVRFELGAYWFNPSIKIIAPWREWEFKSRSELIAFAAEHKIPVEASSAKPYSIDRNILHTSYEGGILEDPDKEPPAEMFQRTVDPRKAPNQSRDVEIRFEKGNPVAVDGQTMGPAALLGELNKIAGEHGVGRADVVEDRFVGMKSRGVYETPGGTLLHKAHRAVASLTMDREAMRLRDSLATEYAALIYRGSGSRPSARPFRTDRRGQRAGDGTGRLRLYKAAPPSSGAALRSPFTGRNIVTFETTGGPTISGRRRLHPSHACACARRRGISRKQVIDAPARSGRGADLRT